MAAPQKVRCGFVDDSDSDDDVKPSLKVEARPPTIIEIVDDEDETRLGHQVKAIPKVVIEISDDEDNTPTETSLDQQQRSFSHQRRQGVMHRNNEHPNLARFFQKPRQVRAATSRHAASKAPSLSIQSAVRSREGINSNSRTAFSEGAARERAAQKTSFTSTKSANTHTSTQDCAIVEYDAPAPALNHNPLSLNYATWDFSSVTPGSRQAQAKSLTPSSNTSTKAPVPYKAPEARMINGGCVASNAYHTNDMRTRSIAPYRSQQSGLKEQKSEAKMVDCSKIPQVHDSLRVTKHFERPPPSRLEPRIQGIGHNMLSSSQKRTLGDIVESLNAESNVPRKRFALAKVTPSTTINNYSSVLTQSTESQCTRSSAVIAHDDSSIVLSSARYRPDRPGLSAPPNVGPHQSAEKPKCKSRQPIATCSKTSEVPRTAYNSPNRPSPPPKDLAVVTTCENTHNESSVAVSAVTSNSKSRNMLPSASAIDAAMPIQQALCTVSSNPEPETPGNVELRNNPEHINKSDEAIASCTTSLEHISSAMTVWTKEDHNTLMKLNMEIAGVNRMATQLLYPPSKLCNDDTSSGSLESCYDFFIYQRTWSDYNLQTTPEQISTYAIADLPTANSHAERLYKTLLKQYTQFPILVVERRIMKDEHGCVALAATLVANNPPHQRSYFEITVQRNSGFRPVSNAIASNTENVYQIQLFKLLNSNKDNGGTGVDHRIFQPLDRFELFTDLRAANSAAMHLQMDMMCGEEGADRVPVEEEMEIKERMEDEIVALDSRDGCWESQFDASAPHAGKFVLEVVRKRICDWQKSI